jgi:cellulose synthase (UDP-forming)
MRNAEDLSLQSPDSQESSLSALFSARVVLFVAYTAAAALYFPWRLTVFNMNAPVFSTLFFFIELISFAWGFVYALSVLRFPERTPPQAPPDLAVDVYIPTYNEPIEIVRRTAFAAMRISYPHETWVLDDGNRPAMRAMAEELGCRYIARTNNLDAKAGNLNNAMKHSKGDFIAMFDADFIADPRFLDRTLGYFNDPKVGFVQTPQEYYNFDSYQHLGKNRRNDSWSEHSLFFRVIQRGRDFFNGAMFCGCSAVLRREALDAVGGIATGTVTEDMHTSFRLHNDGWSSVYHPETLSAGLAPYDALSFRKQRLRWAQGAMQIFRREKLLLGKKSLTAFQGLCYVLHVVTHMEAVHHTVLYLVPFLALLFGISPFDVDFGTWGMFSIPYIVISIFIFEEFSRGYGRLLMNETYNLARCPSSMHAILALFDKRHIPFWVTPKTKVQSGFAFPWIILLLILLALGKISWEGWAGTLPYTGWPLFMMVFWAMLSCLIALRAILLTRRCKLNRRSFSRFPVSLPTTLQSKDPSGGSFDAVITEVSNRGLSLRPAPGKHLPAGPYTGRLRLLGKEIPFEVALHSPARNGVTGGRLSWQTAADHDTFQYLILIDRIRWLRSFDDNVHKTYLAPLLPKKPRLAPSGY